MNAKQTRTSRLIAVLSIAAALKLHYSTAGVSDLLWILTPTTAVVELLAGIDFAFEANVGYMSADHSFLIAPVCAGVNFMIAAFLLLTIQRLRRSGNIGWSFIPISLIVAYVTTIFANSVRIATALTIRRVDPELVWLTPDQFHRFEGIFVYFGFLLLLFVLSERLLSDERSGPPGLRRWLLPALVYYGTTLGVPLLSGAFSRGPAAFLEHSMFVLLTPLLLLIPVIATDIAIHRRSHFLSTD